MEMKQDLKGFISKYYIIFIFVVCFAIGISISSDYGNYYDQDTERTILYSNVKTYSSYSEKLAAYTNDFFAEFSYVKPIEETAELDHGVAMYLPLVPIMVESKNDCELYNKLQHSYTFIFFFLSVIALFYISKEFIKSRLYALLISMLYFTAPRFFAEGHYNNKDMMLLSLMLITYAVGYACIKKPKIIRCIVFAISSALVINIKIVGAIAPGIIGFIFFISIFKEKYKKERFERIVKLVLVFVLVCFLFWLITPAMWGNIKGYFGYLFNNAVEFSRWYGYILFDGEVYSHIDGGIPHRYVIVQYFLTTPVLISILAAIGMVLIVMNAFNIKKIKAFWLSEENLIMLLGWLSSFLLVCYASFSDMVIYNSWRHLYFCFSGVLFAIIYLCKKIYEKKETFAKFKWSAIAACGVYFIIIVGGMILNHPYQYAYFNVFAGKDVQERYEIDYWCVSTSSAVSELAKIVPEENIEITALEVCADARLYPGVYILPEEIRNRFTIYRWGEPIEPGMYILENLTYSNMHAFEDYQAVRENDDLVVEIKAYGNVLQRIYRYNGR